MDLTKVIRPNILALAPYSCARDEFKTNGIPDVDYSITTRELAHLIKQCNINFTNLPAEDFDNPLGESTGASVIFGSTGGVIEAAVRTAYKQEYIGLFACDSAFPFLNFYVTFPTTFPTFPGNKKSP